MAKRQDIVTIIDYLINSISALPLAVSGTGLVICAILAFRAFGFFLSLRWIRTVTNLVYILIVLLLLARYGDRIAEYLLDEKSQPGTEENRPS